MSKFIVEDIKLVNFWKFNIKCDECLICHEKLHCKSLYTITVGSFNIIETGVCGHSFHTSCIHSWINNNKTCPTCLQIFKSNKSITY